MLWRRCFGLLLALFFCVTLSSCGFQLAGQHLPPALKVLYVQSTDPYNEFMRLLHQDLKAQGVTMVSDPSLARTTLFIFNIHTDETQTSVGSDQQTRQYTITFSASFELRNSKGVRIAGPFSLSSQQSVAIFSGVLITNTEQFFTVKEIAERDVLNRLFSVLSSPEIKKSVL